MKRFFVFAFCLVTAFALQTHTASAHQPYYVDTDTAIHIPDAGTSRAYYAVLRGHPALYTVTSEKEFSLYLNILSPYIPGARKDFVVHITDAEGVAIGMLNVPQTDWPEWYEEFAGDVYWKGPEFKKTLPAGTYTIEVSNPGNSGKYVLAPGEAETFTVAGTPHTIQQIYLVKTLFFNKPAYTIFEGVIGKTLLGFVGVLVVIVFFLGRLIYKKF